MIQRHLVWKRFLNFIHTVVVFEIISASSRSSGTTSCIRRGTVGTTGGGAINAAFFALEKKLKITDVLSFQNQTRELQMRSLIYCIFSHPLFLLFSVVMSFSFSPSLLPGSSFGTDGSFSFSSCSLREADFFRSSNSDSGSTSRASSSGIVRVRVRGEAPTGTLKVSWNSIGMLSLKNKRSVLAF